jgi:hypothetical protein
MTVPSIVLGLICSLLIGALFHLWVDGGAGRLLLYLVLSVAGFIAGQWFGTWRNWIILPIGPINLGLAAMGSFVFLGMGYWLSHVELRHPTGDDDGV